MSGLRTGFMTAMICLVTFISRGANGADSVAERAQTDAKLQADANSHFQVLPKDTGTPEFPLTPERVSLGRQLFFDPRISVDGTVSCARCHQPALYATDGLPKSRGAHNKLAPRNAPTILNVGLNSTQHWDGVFQNAEEQARKAVIGPAFGNPDFATAMGRIKAIPGYSELFKQAFPKEDDPVTEGNWAKAIGAYERTLMTPSRFDDYLAGKPKSLTDAEQRGLRIFIEIGCADCHSGAGIGGRDFEKFGVMEDYWKATGSQEIDQGRINVTKNDADQYVFKVAGLRNVEMTPPYFHDGSVRTLSEAVRIMSRVQLGKTLTDDETSAIVTFLNCLTGKLPQSFVEAPVLPPAGFGHLPQ